MLHLGLRTAWWKIFKINSQFHKRNGTIYYLQESGAGRETDNPSGKHLTIYQKALKRFKCPYPLTYPFLFWDSSHKKKKKKATYKDLHTKFFSADDGIYCITQVNLAAPGRTVTLGGERGCMCVHRAARPGPPLYVTACSKLDKQGSHSASRCPLMHSHFFCNNYFQSTRKQWRTKMSSQFPPLSLSHRHPSLALASPFFIPLGAGFYLLCFLHWGWLALCCCQFCLHLSPDFQRAWCHCRPPPIKGHTASDFGRWTQGSPLHLPKKGILLKLRT